jgi:hypothetical protein
MVVPLVAVKREDKVHNLNARFGIRGCGGSSAMMMGVVDQRLAPQRCCGAGKFGGVMVQAVDQDPRREGGGGRGLPVSLAGTPRSAWKVPHCQGVCWRAG